MDNESNGRRRRIIAILIGVAIFVLFAYAVDVTQINLEEPLEPKRQENLARLIRELAQPNFFTYENETRSVNVSLLMPCPEEIKGTQVTLEGRVVVMRPNCVSTTQDTLQMDGTGFLDNAQIVLRWQPNDSPTARTLATFKANDQGEFAVDFRMPDVRESEEPQTIEVVEGIDRTLTGLSETTWETLEKIAVTILMALMASTLGTILAIPISFMGARNLMADLGMPLASIMAGVIAIPIGFVAGYLATGWLVDISEVAVENSWTGLIVLMVTAGLIYLLQLIRPRDYGEAGPPLGSRIFTLIRVLLILLLGIFALAVLAQFGLIAGSWIEENLGLLGFIGNFIFVVSEFSLVLLPAIIGFFAGLIVASYASRHGQEAIFHLSEAPARFLTAILAALGSAMFIFGLLYALWWINLFGFYDTLSEEDAIATLGIVAIIAGGVLGLLSLLAKPKRQYPVGMVTYTVTRTVLNTLRAIEPVIMGFVLVVWVGIGPFAGVMALMLHSIADLGKLFSEQVENIDQGPVEAVTATGASRLQTINFAVVPQIVPHYIAFIFYRWDINVRMSTIIGFVGGGGIGLILRLAANQLRYRDAAVMIIAIALVVTILDFVSSFIRKRVI
jgi:phosphonate transport system permease protein